MWFKTDCLPVGWVSELVMPWLWPQAKKSWRFGFGTKAKAKPPIGQWPGLRFSQAKAKFRPNFFPKARTSLVRVVS
jgi:hypothetical protein